MNDITAKIVPSKVARDIERELAEAREQLEIYRNAQAENKRVIAKAMDDPPSPQWIAIDLIVRELAEAKEQRDRLVVANHNLIRAAFDAVSRINTMTKGTGSRGQLLTNHPWAEALSDAAWDAHKATVFEQSDGD